MPKILTEMKNVGKYLRATHHLYFQTSFFKTNGRQKRLRGCPLQNNFVWQNLGAPIYSRIHDKNLVIIFWSGGVSTPFALHYDGSWFRRKNSKWLQKTFPSDGMCNLTHFLWIRNESNSFSCDFYFSNFLFNIKGYCDVGTIKGT